MGVFFRELFRASEIFFVLAWFHLKCWYTSLFFDLAWSISVPLESINRISLSKKCKDPLLNSAAYIALWITILNVVCYIFDKEQECVLQEGKTIVLISIFWLAVVWHLPVRAVCAKVSLSCCDCGQCQVPESRASSCSLLLPQRHQCKSSTLNSDLYYYVVLSSSLLHSVLSPHCWCCFSRHRSVGAVSLSLVSAHDPQTMSRCCRPSWSQILSVSSCMWWTQGQRWEIRNPTWIVLKVWYTPPVKSLEYFGYVMFLKEDFSAHHGYISVEKKERNITTVYECESPRISILYNRARKNFFFCHKGKFFIIKLNYLPSIR